MVHARLRVLALGIEKQVAQTRWVIHPSNGVPMLPDSPPRTLNNKVYFCAAMSSR